LFEPTPALETHHRGYRNEKERGEVWQHVAFPQRPGCRIAPVPIGQSALELEIRGEAALFHRFEKHANTS
jgi:hypothetical protein